jgi:hypothetical protein
MVGLPSGDSGPNRRPERRRGQPQRHIRPRRNPAFRSRLVLHLETGVTAMRPVLLWLLGIPIPIIILLYLFHVV